MARARRFAVDGIEDVIASLRTHSAELAGELAQHEDSYRLCYVRGPEPMMVGLFEQLTQLKAAEETVNQAPPGRARPPHSASASA